MKLDCKRSMYSIDGALAMVEIIDKGKFVSAKFGVNYLEKVIKALKALEVEEVELGVSEDGVAVLFISDRLGIALAPRV